MEINLNQIDLICSETDERLWGAYNRSIGEEFQSQYDSNLIFPEYSGRQNGAIRVSEQEARFAFTESLSATPFFYSVETPTEEEYRFTGSKAMSAQTDLTFD